MEENENSGESSKKFNDKANWVDQWSILSTAMVAVFISLITLYVGLNEKQEKDTHEKLHDVQLVHHDLDADKKREIETLHLLEVEEKDAYNEGGVRMAHDKIKTVNDDIHHVEEEMNALLSNEQALEENFHRSEKKNSMAHYAQAFFEIAILLTSIANLTKRMSFLIVGLATTFVGGIFTVIGIVL